MNRDLVQQLANIAALVVTLIFNTVTQLPNSPIGLGTNGEIANRYPDLLYFPANYAFSIWGIIYTFQIAFTIYQVLPSQRDNPHLRRLGLLPVFIALGNVAWLLAFSYYQFPLSMVAMLFLLGVLITAYLRLGIGRTAVSLRNKLLVHIPFSLYLGWITAATVTNAAYVLRDAGWNGFGIEPEIWAAVMLAVTGVLALGVIFRHRDIAYALVIIWAVVAIAQRHPNVQLVAGAAYVVAVVVALAIIAALFINRDRLFAAPRTPARA